MTTFDAGLIVSVGLQEVAMRKDHKRLAGLLLFLLIGAVAFVTWYRRDKTGVSTSMPASSSVSSPIATGAGSGATRAGSGADTERPTQTAPPAEPAGAGAGQGTNSEASKRIGTDGAKAMRGGARPKAAGASKAKSKDAEKQETAPATAQAQAESSEHIDAGTHAEPTPEPVQPPREMGMLIGRIHNSMGSTFRLTKISFFVDGSQVATQNYPSGLEPGADAQVFEHRVDPGNHTLRALVEYQGDPGGVFTYFEGYHYKVSSSHEFAATANATTQITVVTYEKGGLLTSFENRLGVAFRVGTATSK
jgi:hypothetical protein